MAKILFKHGIEGISGKLGPCVVFKRDGVYYVRLYKKPRLREPHELSEKEKETRAAFKHATKMLAYIRATPSLLDTWRETFEMHKARPNSKHFSTLNGFIISQFIGLYRDGVDYEPPIRNDKTQRPFDCEEYVT